MFYLGYCDMCNYLDASVDRYSLLEFLIDHQETKHGHSRVSKIHLLNIHLPYRIWLLIRRNPKFWEAWRNRKKTTYVLARLKQLGEGKEAWERRRLGFRETPQVPKPALRHRRDVSLLPS